MGNEKTIILEKASKFAERLKESPKATDVDFANNMAQELSSIIWEAKLAHPSNNELKHLFDEQRLFTSTHSKTPRILLNNVNDSIKQLLSIIEE